MSRLFWPLFAVNVVFAGLVLLALPFGPDVVYGLLAGSQLGMMVILGRACSRLSWEISEPLPPSPPSHPVWRNPQV